MSTEALRAAGPRARVVPADALAVAAWGALVLAGYLLGAALYADDPLVRVGAPPLVGSYDVRVGLEALPALVLAAAGVAWAPAIAQHLRFRWLLATAWAASVAWALALAMTDGAGAITRPLLSRYEYLVAVDRVGSPSTFLGSFVGDLSSYPTHVRGHPPGLVLLLAGLRDAGLGGATVAAALVIGAGALAAPAVLVALREIAGAEQARAAAPFVIFLPGAVWMATSADALFTGVLACGAALFALACGRADARGDALALAGGAVLGVGLMLSYGAVPFGVVVLAIALWRRRLRPVVLAGAGVTAVLGTFWALGFLWPEGLSATRDQALAGVLARRPYFEFLVIAAAAFALVVGPAAAAGLARLRQPAMWILSGGALLAVALADLSGLSRGETERIWLPFAPWVVLAAAGLGRGWLGAQVVLGLALQLGVRSPW